MDSISSIFSLAISSNVFFTSELFIGFLLGVIPSVSTLIYKECIKKIKIKKLIQLHHKTYIKPVIDSLESVLFENNLDKSGYIYEFRKLSDEIEGSIKNIDFSLNNEYSVLNSDHTFELIRTAEFTKKILMESRKQLNHFASLAVQREEKNIANYMGDALEKTLKMIELNWGKNTDYIYLKRLDIFSENKTDYPKEDFMKNAIFKQPSFYIAIASFFIGLFLIFQDGPYLRLNSFLWQLNFIFNSAIASKAVHQK